MQFSKFGEDPEDDAVSRVRWSCDEEQNPQDESTVSLFASDVDVLSKVDQWKIDAGKTLCHCPLVRGMALREEASIWRGCIGLCMYQTNDVSSQDLLMRRGRRNVEPHEHSAVAGYMSAIIIMCGGCGPSEDGAILLVILPMHVRHSCVHSSV